MNFLKTFRQFSSPAINTILMILSGHILFSSDELSALQEEKRVMVQSTAFRTVHSGLILRAMCLLASYQTSLFLDFLTHKNSTGPIQLLCPPKSKVVITVPANRKQSESIITCYFPEYSDFQHSQLLLSLLQLLKNVTGSLLPLLAGAAKLVLNPRTLISLKVIGKAALLFGYKSRQQHQHGLEWSVQAICRFPLQMCFQYHPTPHTFLLQQLFFLYM